MRQRSLLVPALACALLAACGGEAEGGDDDRTASGEVLEGSVSDTMIPLDRLDSQPPLIRERAAASGEASVDEGETDPAADEGPGENPLEAGSAAE